MPQTAMRGWCQGEGGGSRTSILDSGAAFCVQAGVIMVVREVFCYCCCRRSGPIYSILSIYCAGITPAATPAATSPAGIPGFC